MKKIILFFLLLLPTLAMAQLYVVHVKSLCGKGDYGWEGVVLQKDADTEAFYKLMVELDKHGKKWEAMNTQKSLKKNSSGTSSDETFAKLEQARKMGLLSDAEAEKMKAEFLKAGQQAAEADKKINEAASATVSSDPAVLKEKIRQYCVGKRFYRHVCDEVDGVRRVDVGSHINSGVDMPRYRGFINAVTGEAMVEPDRYTEFNIGVSIGSMCFNTEGKAIAHIRSIDGQPSSACMIDRKGSVLLSGDYLWLSFFMDCHLLKAENLQRKYGIIDYDGNVLEPFIHNGPNAPGMYQARDRIVKEKGLPKLKLF